MSLSAEIDVQDVHPASRPLVERLLRDLDEAEADAKHLDFIPDKPAELRRAVADMAAHLNFADWRFVKLIAAMDRTGGWREGGYCSLGNWLDHRCGLGPCAARERIRIGRALERLPRIDAAFRDGVISYSKVRAITRVATPETDAMLLAIAEGSSAARLESLVRTHERAGGGDGPRAGSEARRCLTWHYEDGMLFITAAVPAERGALVVKALQQVVDGRRDERDEVLSSGLPFVDTEASAAVPQDDAAPADDAVTLDGEWACVESEAAPSSSSAASGTAAQIDVSGERPVDGVCAEDGGEVSPPVAIADIDAGSVSGETDEFPDWLTFSLASREQRLADALVDIAEHSLAGPGPLARRRPGRRYEVVLTIGRNELARANANVGRSNYAEVPPATPADAARYHVAPDWGIDGEDARHVACDADVTELIQDAGGNLLNYERRRRVVPARLARALRLRDRDRCRFPGCAHQRYLEAHHVRHWIDGGETSLDNLVLLCGAHHRLLHHGAFHVVMEDGAPVFVGRDGEVLPPALSPQFPPASADVSGGVSGKRSGRSRRRRGVARPTCSTRTPTARSSTCCTSGRSGAGGDAPGRKSAEGVRAKGDG